MINKLFADYVSGLPFPPHKSTHISLQKPEVGCRIELLQSRLSSLAAGPKLENALSYFHSPTHVQVKYLFNFDGPRSFAEEICMSPQHPQNPPLANKPETGNCRLTA